ncbi:MAG: Ig-like domain-containing protein [Dehalococcoidia bacterium]
MKRLEIVLCFLLVLAIGAISCASEEATPTPTPTSTPTPTPSPAATPVPTPTGLFLEVAELEDESVVDTASITVSGSTLPAATVSVSVNDEIQMADVSEDGSFNVTITLEEGPNLIEVIASDLEGNEVSTTLTIIYNF